MRSGKSNRRKVVEAIRSFHQCFGDREMIRANRQLPNGVFSITKSMGRGLCGIQVETHLLLYGSKGPSSG